MSKVVVLGSGAAGLSAALSAAVAGAEVTVLEAAPYIGGTTGISGGVAWIPANPWMAAGDAADTPEAALEYLRAVGIGDHDAARTEAYVHAGPHVAAEVEAHTPLRWQQMVFPDYQAEFPGAHLGGRGIEIMPVAVGREVVESVRPDPYGARRGTVKEMAEGKPTVDELDRREREGVEVGGRGLVAGLYAALRERGVPVRTGARVTRLCGSADGVTGVEVGGDRLSGQVVIATGGFERNDGLTRTFLRVPLAAPAGPPTNVGDGLRMGMSVGAALGNMSEAWWCPAMAVPGGTFDGAPLYAMLFGDCGLPGGVLVDGRGRRFADEAADYSSLGRAFQSFDAATHSFPGLAAWLIFDAPRRAERGFADEATWSLTPGAGSAQGAATGSDPEWLVRAETLGELAGRIGVPAEALNDTVERYNAHAADGVDPDFLRGSTHYDRFMTSSSLSLPAAAPSTDEGPRPARQLDGPPYYAVRVLLGCLGTKGGLRADARARALRADGGGPIPGLYAAGNAAANPFGAGYPGPGATIGPALVFGWLAGETAASA